MPAGRLLTLSEVLHIYTRVSTLAQAEEGMGLEVQLEIGLQRAKQLGFEAKVWDEGGKSSNHEEIDKRPVLTQLLAEIQRGAVKHLYVYDQSRLSRNDYVSSIFRYECNKQGVTLYNKEGKYDLANPQDQFLKQILDAVGQFDNAQRAERTRLGKLARIRQGNWMGGPPPYGYTIKDRKLVVEEEEAKWVRYVFQQYADRVPLIDVKFELDAQGVQPRRKRGTWTMGSLQALMRNTHYIGYWDFKDGKTGEEIRVECPRILPSDLWSKVQKTKEEHLVKRNSTNAVKHFYMLKNVLRCGHCGTWMSGVQNPKQPSKNHYYCPKKERVWSKRPIAEDDKWKRGRVCEMTRSLNIAATDELIWNTVIEIITKSRAFREKTKVEILGEGYSSAKVAEGEVKAATLKIRQLQKTLAKAQDALARVETDRLMERISPDQYPIIRDNITNEKVAIEAEIEQLSAKVEGIGRDRRWVKWLDNFRQKIHSFKNFSPEQRKEVLAGLLTSVDVFMIDSQTHWLDIQFNVPLVDDELVYRDPSNKKLGYAIKGGMTTFMVELSQKSHSKKKPIEPTT
jgi:DNA invertase Pin-like site-specific DNA recombinase